MSSAGDPGSVGSTILHRSNSVDGNALLDAWFREYSDRVLAYLLHRTDPQTAQDLVQEVFILAYRKHGEIPIPPIGWLFGAARKLLANKNRSFRRQNQLVQRIAEDAAQTTDVTEAELKLRFADALSALSQRDREVLTLTGWYGLTASEAAEALGCSARTYAVRLHRARTRLSDHLGVADKSSASAALRLAEDLHD